MTDCQESVIESCRFVDRKTVSLTTARGTNRRDGCIRTRVLTKDVGACESCVVSHDSSRRDGDVAMRPREGDESDASVATREVEVEVEVDRGVRRRRAETSRSRSRGGSGGRIGEASR